MNDQLQNANQQSQKYCLSIIKLKTMRKTKIIELLNTLFHINVKRIARFNNAQSETAEPGLKKLFSGFIRTSTDCQAALSNEAQILGATLDEGPKAMARDSNTSMLIGQEPSSSGQGTWIDAFGEEEFSMLCLLYTSDAADE